MRKKQLAQQNTALFAEIERKAGEIEALQLQIEELTAERDAAEAQKERLEHRIVALQTDYDQLKEQEMQLADALRVALLKNAQADMSVDAVEPPQDQPPSSIGEVSPEIPDDEANPPYTEEAPQQTEPQYEESACPTQTTPEPVEPILNPAPEQPAPTVPVVHRPDLALLRAHGAELIGRLTRQTAELIAGLEDRNDPNAESVKTVILGKNEGFKYQILSLMQTEEDTAAILEKMNQLADETATYLTLSLDGSRQQ